MKTSIIFYYEWLPLIESMPDAARLAFYDAMLNPQKRNAFNTSDKHLEAVFNFVLSKVIESEEKYQAIVEKRRIAASFGGKQKVANASKRKQVLPKAAYNVNDNDNDNVNENEKKNILTKPENVSDSVWRDFRALRKTKRAPITNTVIAGIESEAVKAGWTLDRALAECCARGWQGFKADWVTKDGGTKPRRRPSL